MADQSDGGSTEGQATGAKEGFADDIAALYDQLAAEPEDAAEPAAQAEETGTEVETEAEAEPETDEAEDADGDEDAELEAADDGQEPGEGEDEAGEPEDDAEPAEAPEHWSDADKEAFAGLPDEAKPLWLDKVKSLESGYGQKFEALAAERKELEPYRGFADLFEPFRADLATAGITAEQYTRQLVATALQMRQDPATTLNALATQYGVALDTGKPDNGAGAQPDTDEGIDEFTDPAVIAMRDQIRKQSEIIEGLSSKFDQSQSQQEQASNQQVEAAWSQFVGAQDEAGAELHPGSAELRARVAAELQITPPRPDETVQTAFKRAYDDVKWIVPELRERTLKAERAVQDNEAEQKQKEAARETQRKADLQKAKKAGRTVKSKSAPVSEAPSATKTNREELERQWDLQEQSG